MQRLRQLTAPKPEWTRRRFSVRKKAVAKWGDDALATQHAWSAQSPYLDSKVNEPIAGFHGRGQSLEMGPDDVFIDDSRSSQRDAKSPL